MSALGRLSLTLFRYSKSRILTELSYDNIAVLKRALEAAPVRQHEITIEKK